MAYAIQNVREDSASDGDYDEDLARWLEESGRRRAIPRKLAEGTDIETSASAANDTARLSLRRLALAAVFTLSAAQYLYTDIGLQIVQVPSLVVFAVAATR